ncbi:MAG: hypothetical protein ACW98Y_12325 [Candidatus Thorarchaeota archaeon]|jgi:hypothetical protein
MIVAEDKETNEVRQFLLVDAGTNLGLVQLGTSIRSFDPGRLIRYYELVASQLYDYATRYSASFQFQPRRAYSYLSKPPLLANIYESVPSTADSSWMCDLFLANPLIEITGKPLPRFKQKNNIDATFRWATQSQYAPRLYSVKDLRHDFETQSGWGCRLDPNTLETVFKSSVRDPLISCISAGEPIFIKIEQERDIEPLLEWLVLTKEAKLPHPELIFSVPSYKEHEQQLKALLEIPRTRLLTSGASIGTLSSIINMLKIQSGKMHWSEKIVFASAYPETQRGDSVTEILSFILSRNLGATPLEIQRVLAGNILSLLPSRPRFKNLSPSEGAILAEGKLGETALLEISRLLRILTAQKLHRVVSIDLMTDESGGTVDFNTAVLNIEEIATTITRSVAIHVERDGSLRISGWRDSFTDSMPNRSGTLLRTLIKASDKGPSLDAPSHLATFNKSFLTAIGVQDPRGVISSLHFDVHPEDINSGTILMCPDDMKAIGVSAGNVVTVLDAISGHWWGTRVEESNACPSRKLIVPKVDVRDIGLTENTKLDVVRYTDETIPITNVLLTYESTPGYNDAELTTHIHLAREDWERATDSKLIGMESRFLTSGGVELDVTETEPPLQRGQLGYTQGSSIEILPRDFLSDVNLLLVIAAGNDMKVKDISLANPSTSKQFLYSFTEKVSELDRFLSNLSSQASRLDIAKLITLLTIERMRKNKTDGRLGVIFVDNSPTKFSIQKGGESQEYIEFDDDMQNEEVFASLLYSILDAGELPDGNTNPESTFRSIAEVLEDFGSERPTLVIVCSNFIGDPEGELQSYLEAISSNTNYRLDIIGMGEQFDVDHAKRVVQGLKSRILHIEDFSTFEYLGYLQWAVKNLSSG